MIISGLLDNLIIISPFYLIWTVFVVSPFPCLLGSKRLTESQICLFFGNCHKKLPKNLESFLSPECSIVCLFYKGNNLNLGQVYVCSIVVILLADLLFFFFKFIYLFFIFILFFMVNLLSFVNQCV